MHYWPSSNFLEINFRAPRHFYQFMKLSDWKWVFQPQMNYGIHTTLKHLYVCCLIGSAQKYIWDGGSTASKMVLLSLALSGPLALPGPLWPSLALSGLLCLSLVRSLAFSAALYWMSIGMCSCSENAISLYERIQDNNALWRSCNGRCNIFIQFRIFNFASHFIRVQIDLST